MYIFGWDLAGLAEGEDVGWECMDGGLFVFVLTEADFYCWVAVWERWC